MPTAENAKLQYEAGQTLVATHALTDAGDHKTYGSATATYWSSRAGYAPVVNPNGIITGFSVSAAASLGNNKIDVTAGTCYLAGVSTSVGASADTLTITRPATAVSKINSVTVNSSGAFAMVAGDDGSTTAFSEVRGDAGGPPSIPLTSIEVAQIRVISDSAAPITEDQIFQTIGTHRELYNYPAVSVYPIGDDDHAAAYVSMTSALPVIHGATAGNAATATKGVYARVSTPTFAEVPIASDFTPPLNSRSVSSSQYYRKTVASSSASLGQGSFTAVLDDGITDPLSVLDGEFLSFRFYPDADKSAHLLCQGYLSVPPTYPAADLITASCTISAELEAVRKAS